jgi:hypothetical protein
VKGKETFFCDLALRADIPAEEVAATEPWRRTWQAIHKIFQPQGRDDVDSTLRNGPIARRHQPTAKPRIPY